MAFNDLNIDYINEIIGYIDQKSYISMLLICKEYYAGIRFKRLTSEFITQAELEKPIFSCLEYLEVNSNECVYSVNHLKYLKILHCKFNSNIDQAGISQCNLQELDAYSNPKITSIII